MFGLESDQLQLSVFLREPTKKEKGEGRGGIEKNNP